MSTVVAVAVRLRHAGLVCNGSFILVVERPSFVQYYLAEHRNRLLDNSSVLQLYEVIRVCNAYRCFRSRYLMIADGSEKWLVGLRLCKQASEP